MAVTKGRSPILMTAAGDTVSHKVKVAGFRYVAGGSGKAVLKNSSSGNALWESAQLNANEADESISYLGWVDGIYLDTISGGGTVFVYYE